MRAPVVIVFVFVLSLGSWVSASALRFGEEGVCRRQSNDPRRPDKLYCCNNWKYDAKQKKCVYHCRLGCGEGKCVGPNRCSCDPPNVMVADKCVKPTCEPSCVNATCTGYNTCTCSAGYEKINATHCAPTCVTGYKRPCANGACAKSTIEADPLACVPICEPNCTNGICTEPGVCQCHEGFANTSRWRCDPVCDGCEHGTCAAPNNCICNEGYSMKGGRCVPDCEPKCMNGICTEPGVCQCHEGFVNTSRWQCDPVCDGCEHGTCAAPNNCICNEGYSMKGGRCMPDCRACVNGVCTAPGVCNCNDGYSATVGAEGSCSPVCEEPCVNADCVAPNRCKCAPGFVKDEERHTVCYEPCESSCGNGTCTNGTCECHLGYVMENGTCVALPPVPCKDCDGNCTDDGLCFCSDKSPCFDFIAEPAEIASSARLAGLEITWLVGAVVGLLILTLMIVIISYMWRKRKEYGAKPAEEQGMYNQSVVYTVSNTLLQNRDEERLENEYDIPNEKGQNEGAGENLLDGTIVRNDKMYD
ncbi:unnamed protein product, partial [Iphiclides podalirius]